MPQVRDPTGILEGNARRYGASKATTRAVATFRQLSLPLKAGRCNHMQSKAQAMGTHVGVGVVAIGEAGEGWAALRSH